MQRSTTAAVLTLYLLSGGAALMYEVSWMRQIGEVLGHSAPAAGVVLAAYFAGLAWGYELGGRWLGQVHPLRGYATAELVAAAWAVAIPCVLTAAAQPAVAAWLGNSRQPGAAILQTGLCLVLLLPATAALGATLPFMAGWFALGRTGGGWRWTTLAYALNTLGAAAGVVLATGGLLMQAGVRNTSWIAAGISVACAGGAWLLSHNAGLPLAGAQPEGRPLPASSISRTHWAGWLAAATSGFTVLALEVLYLRLFSLVLHNSSYSFAAVVVVFLLALTVGALLAAWLIRRVSGARLAAAGLTLGSVAIAASVFVFIRRSGLEYLTTNGGLVGYLRGSALLAIAVMLPPVALLGLTLPAAWRLTATPAALARLTLVNTLAAAAGALSASFLLLPGLGLWNSFAALIGLAGASAVVICWAFHSRWLAVGSLTATAASLATLLLASPTDALTTRQRDDQLLRRWETAYGWIDVVRNTRSGALDIRQNLHYRYGSTGDDARRELRQAHLPLLLHPNPRDVLFLGLGTGVTAAGATQHPEVERITVVELIPEVVAAARMLGAGNRHVVDHPRVAVAVDDARHYLLTTPEPFDVVVGDLFVPWESETGYLYTREHFQRVRDKLRPGGVYCQWLALYQLGPEEFQLIADTFASVFPETTLWWGHLHPRRPMLALIGANQPLQWDAAALERRCAALSEDELWVDDQIRTPEHLLELLRGRWTTRPAAWLNTVEHPRVEFSAPWSQQGDLLLHGGNLRRFLEGDALRLPPPSPANGLPIDAVALQRITLAQRYVLFGE